MQLLRWKQYRSTHAPALRTDLLAVFFSFGVLMFSLAALGPVLDEIRQEFNIGFAGIGFLVAGQGMARGGFMLIFGPLADRMSPRRLLPVGLAATGLGSLIAAAAPNVWVLVGGIVAGGAGFGLVAPSGQVHVAHRTPQHNRRRDLGRLISGGMLGAFIAPAAAGAAANAFGWRAAFLLVGLVAITAAVLVASTRTLSSDAPIRSSPSRLRRPSLGIGRGVMEIAILAILMWGWANATRGIVLPLYGSVALGLTPRDVGLLLTLTLGGRAVLTFLSGPIANRIGLASSLLIATLGGAVGTLFLFAPSTLGIYVVLGVAFALSGIGSPIVLMLLIERAPAQHLGRAVGVTQFLVDLVGLAMPPLIGLLLDTYDFGVVGALLAGIYLAAATWGLRILRRGGTDPNNTSAH